MADVFFDEFKAYREKCDNFFKSGECREFFKQYDVESSAGPYLDALTRHSLGGKRIRAFLVYLGYCLFLGFDNADKVFLPSLSYELFQTGILAHDDIIDNSDTRRHKPSMHMDLGGGHAGVSKSICVGDLGIVSASDVILESDFDNDKKLLAVCHQNKIFASTIAGELKDIEFSLGNEVDLSEIIEMYRLKTAKYTVSGPLVLGGILSGADDKHIKLLSEFGDNLGVAFQIKDDILGIFAEGDSIGKSNFSDMCEGKQTVLTAHFYKTASDEMLKHFSCIYGNANSGEDELLCVREMFIKAGSLEFAETLCHDYTDKALTVLEKFDFDNDKSYILQGLITYMLQRKS